MNNQIEEVRKIKAFGKELSYAEYVEICVTANFGTQSVYLKQDLEALCKERKIKLYGNKSKTELYEMLIENGMQPYEFECIASSARFHRSVQSFKNNQFVEEPFGIGVTTKMYQDEFGISYDEVKKLIDSGFLIKVGVYRSKYSGKYTYPTKYSAWQFVTLTNAELAEALSK